MISLCDRRSPDAFSHNRVLSFHRPPLRPGKSLLIGTPGPARLGTPCQTERRGIRTSGHGLFVDICVSPPECSGFPALPLFTRTQGVTSMALLN